jgi:hypothetical protein
MRVRATAIHLCYCGDAVWRRVGALNQDPGGIEYTIYTDYEEKTDGRGQNAGRCLEIFQFPAIDPVLFAGTGDNEEGSFTNPAI